MAYDLVLKAIEEKIKTETSIRDYYEKEILKYQGYHSDQIIKIDSLQKEYDKLKEHLNIKETV